MIITRETDYAMRTIRALSKEKKLNIKQICEYEKIPMQFAYKILKKLSEEKIIKIIRGAGGGYVLIADLNKLTMYDIIKAIENESEYNCVNICLNDNNCCENNSEGNFCKMNKEFKRINDIIESEFKRIPFINFV